MEGSSLPFAAEPSPYAENSMTDGDGALPPCTGREFMTCSSSTRRHLQVHQCPVLIKSNYLAQQGLLRRHASLGRSATSD